MIKRCSCKELIKEVWSTVNTPLPPGDIGGCVYNITTIYGSCGNGCAGVKIGELPLLSVSEQPLNSLEQVRKAIDLN